MNDSIFRKEYNEYCILLKRVPSLLLTILVLSVVSMNLLANKELFRADWVALDCGFILSWIPFLIMDVICKAYGGKAAVRISVLAIAVNLVLFIIFKLVAQTSGMWGAYYETGSLTVNEALNNTIGGSSWIVLWSAASMTVASCINSLVNISVAKLANTDSYAAFAFRSFTSTIVSQFTDNFIFALCVSVPLFGWSLKQALICSLVAALFELSVEVIFSRMGYRLSKKLK